MEVLEKLLGSGTRIKVMRFFLMSPEGIFTLKDAAKSLRLGAAKVKRELTLLGKTGFLKQRIKESEIFFKTKKRPKKKREKGFVLNQFFPFLREFRALIVEAAPISRELLQRRFRSLGRGLRLVLLSGIFTNKETPGHVDILVVGDSIRRSRIEKILGKIEAELGKELKYVIFDTNEFKYRQGMYDRFLHDILESEHDVLIDNLKS